MADSSNSCKQRPRYHEFQVNTPQLNRRIESPALQQLRRPFNGSATRLTYFQKGDRRIPLGSVQSPKQQPKPRHEYNEDYDDPFPPPPPPPPPRFSKAPNTVVGGLIGICVATYGYSDFVTKAVASNASSESIAALRALDTYFVQSPKNMKEGRYYTLITAAFMHKNLMHLVFNTIGLWSFGRPVVSLFGAPSFLVLYFGSVVAGGLFQNYVWESQNQWNVGAVGASGGVLGVLAATACVMPKCPMSVFFVPMPMWMGLAITVGISVGGLQGRWLPSLGHADHLGGMAFGVVWWLVAMRRGRIYLR
jgi:membrane associated rhomboid family serine protease